MRSQEEIDAQSSALEVIKNSPSFRHNTFFGDSNDEAIEAQIEVLEEGLTYINVADRRDDYWSDHAADSADSVLSWLSGDTDDTPASKWEGLY